MGDQHAGDACCGLGERIGKVAPGFNADVVIWSGNPFSIYSHADQVFIDGALVYDRAAPAAFAALGLRARPAGDGRRGHDRARRLIALAALVFTCVATHARDRGNRACTRMDVDDDTALEDATIVMTDGRIVAVGDGRSRYRRVRGSSTRKVVR